MRCVRENGGTPPRRFFATSCELLRSNFGTATLMRETPFPARVPCLSSAIERNGPLTKATNDRGQDQQRSPNSIVKKIKSGDHPQPVLVGGPNSRDLGWLNENTIVYPTPTFKVAAGKMLEHRAEGLGPDCNSGVGISITGDSPIGSQPVERHQVQSTKRDSSAESPLTPGIPPRPPSPIPISTIGMASDRANQ